MVDYEELENDDFNQTPQLHEHFRCKVDKGQSLLRIDKYLFNCMAGTSRNRIQEAADAGNILVNGKSVKSSYRVKPNDEISLVLAYPPTDYTIIPQDIPLNIVYEDDQIVLVNKQPGLVVHQDLAMPMEHCSTHWHGICATIRHSTRMTPESDWFIASTKTLPACC